LTDLFQIRKGVTVQDRYESVSSMADFIAIVIIVMILGLAIRYIYKEKKKGVHCIGCPSAGACHKATCSCKDK
jgi:hypothetical protein